MTKNESSGFRQTGYVIAIAVNAGLIYVVTHLLEWDLFGFLTDDFEALVPIIVFALVVNIVVNFAYLWYDNAWFKTLTQLLVNVISLVVTVRIFRVFPFDFTGYDVDFAFIVRAVLVLAMVGLGIAIIAEGAKLIGIVRDRPSQP